MKVTIRDIARHTGVSSATVSNVLNNKPAKVGEATRDRILAAVAELDYNRNALARGLNSGKSQTIGIIVPDISIAHFSVLVAGIEAAAHRAGYGILICNAYNRIDKEREYFDVLTGKSVDGIVIAAGSAHGGREHFRFGPSPIPLVLIDRSVEGLEGPCGVYWDKRHETYLGTVHLLDRGHTRIGCIAGPIDSPNTRDRIDGYKQALTERGIGIRENWLYTGEHSTDSGMRGMLRMLEGDAPTAVVAGGDLLAYGVYKALNARGLRIPDDMSVVGVDDSVYSDIITPKLTALRPPLGKIGAKAIDLLQSLMNDVKLRKRSVVYQPELIVRESTAKPRQAIGPL